ncbi:unnamed protein product, partial [Prorocentrum cordatum]
PSGSCSAACPFLPGQEATHRGDASALQARCLWVVQMAIFDRLVGQMVLVAGIVGPTFVLSMLHFISCVREVNIKWAANQDRRHRRKAASNRRMHFDQKGVVVSAAVQMSSRSEYFDQLAGYLHALAEGLVFGNPMLLKFHGPLKLAAEVADRCSDSARGYLHRENVDDSMISSFEPLNQLLEELMDRKQPSGDLKTRLNAFKEDLAVIHAAFGAGAPAGAQQALEEALLGEDGGEKKFFFSRSRGASVPEFDADPLPELVKRVKKAKQLQGRAGEARAAEVLAPLEPVEIVDGVHVRLSGLMFWATSQRDKFGIGSTRTALAALALVLALGPARFAGHAGSGLVIGVVAVGLVMELLAVCDSKSSGNRLRRAGPLVLLAAAVAVLALGGLDSLPTSIAELEAKPTFLPAPPQYNLNIRAQQLYVPLIYGVMHGNLVVLMLLPLPVCYYAQAQLADRYPRLRWLVPQNPVWAHRMLGYALLGGISVAGFVWLLAQGQQCLSQTALNGADNAPACFAFDPAAIRNEQVRRDAVDVFVLRFHMVWPLIYPRCLTAQAMMEEAQPSTRPPAGGGTRARRADQDLRRGGRS